MARTISVRELRNTPSEVWEALTHDDLVLTSNGEPLAVLARIEGTDVEGTLAALRRARAQQAVSRLRAAAREAGTDTLTAEEIEAEIEAARGAATP
jgi:antitoxin (DNA-binding transcriptional repressor) of toxin-antitoxin stability system